MVTVRGLTEGRKTRQVVSAHKIQLGSFVFVGLKILISRRAGESDCRDDASQTGRADKYVFHIETEEKW